MDKRNAMNDLVSPRILAVDDDAATRQLIYDYLTENELRVSTVASGQEMATVLQDQAIDLIVLDLRMPGEDGMQIARKLREQSSIPIIILTGRLDEADRVMGLELGADDYVTKPFNPRELLARIRTVLRRTKAAQSPAGKEEVRRAYRFGGWELNLRTRRLTSPEGERVELTKGEFSLLTALLGAPQRVLSRDQLLEMSRLYDDEVYDRSIDVQILRLRRKIEVNPSEPQFINTERRAGYIFSVPVEVLY
jgi:two-component system, OmpR family, response regulator